MSGSDPDFMQSLARGLQVVEAFGILGPNQTISSIAQQTGLARGVVARCLHTLVVLQYVVQRDRFFSLLPNVLRLAEGYLSDRSLPALAQPLIERVRDDLGESCSLGVLDRADVLYVARASRSRIMNISLHVGSRLPAWCTSMGRVLLASLPQPERDALVPPSPLSRKTPNTTTDRAALMRLLDRIAADGFALVDQELEIGLRSIAVPVHDRHGHTVAALNVGANALERSVEDLSTIALPRLQEAAAQLGAQLP